MSMYITYHERMRVHQDDEVMSMPHKALHLDIRMFLEENDVEQKSYVMSYNGFCLFIYLSNGDRVDVAF